jgi:hypothetical protein
MEKEVTGYADCIFCHEYDMSCGYGCSLDGSEEIKQNKKYQPIDPEWCRK